MFELFNTHIEYWHWIVAGLLIATAEIFVSTFVMLCLGVSAVIIGVLLLFMPMEFSKQVSTWGIMSGVLFFLWNRYATPRMQKHTLSALSEEAIVGQAGTVLSFNEIQGTGVLRFPTPIQGSDEWTFIFTGSLHNGDKVRVIGLSGESLIVSFYQ